MVMQKISGGDFAFIAAHGTILTKVPFIYFDFTYLSFLTLKTTSIQSRFLNSYQIKFSQ